MHCYITSWNMVVIKQKIFLKHLPYFNCLVLTSPFGLCLYNPFPIKCSVLRTVKFIPVILDKKKKIWKFIEGRTDRQTHRRTEVQTCLRRWKTGDQNSLLLFCVFPLDFWFLYTVIAITFHSQFRWYKKRKKNKSGTRFLSNFYHT